MGTEQPITPAVPDRRRGGPLPGPGHVAAAIALVVVHAVLVLGSGYVLALFAMGSDACGRQLWCDRPWVDVGFAVGVGAGAVLWVVDLVVSTILLVRRRRCVWVPLAGCGVQLVLLGISGWLVLRPATGS